MEFLHKILLSEEVLNKMNIFLKKKKEIWSKNPKIYFQQFELSLAEGGYRFFLKKQQIVKGAIKM